MNREHLDHDSALELFINAFMNGDAGDDLYDLASVDYAGGSTATRFHLASGERWSFYASEDDPHEMQMRIRPRHCVLSGATPVADAASCLLAYAEQLMKAATALEVAEGEYLEQRKRNPAMPAAKKTGKVVAQ